MADITVKRVAEIPLDKITVAPNVRRDVRRLESLTESIRQHGILQPLVCIPGTTEDTVQVIIGQRRLAAARIVGLKTAPCILRPPLANQDRLLKQLAENHERDDMSMLDEAHAFAALVGDGMNVAQIARAIHRTDRFVRRRLDLLELPEPVQELVDEEIVSAEVALFHIPRAVYQDRDELATLVKIARRTGGGDTAVRTWLLDRAKAHSTTTSEPGRRSSKRGQQFVARIRVDLHDRALRDARRRGLSAGAWLEMLIEEHVPA